MFFETERPSRDELESIYSILTGPPWTFLESRLQQYRDQILADLVASGSSKHDFNIGRLKAIDQVLGIRLEFNQLWTKLSKEGLL